VLIAKQAYHEPYISKLLIAAEMQTFYPNLGLFTLKGNITKSRSMHKISIEIWYAPFARICAYSFLLTFNPLALMMQFPNIVGF
jgi:hypothetical protein